MAAVKKPLYLHVGLPKTGTTQLQGVLWANRQVLRERGVLYPGEKAGAHWWAARDLLGSRSPTVQGAWRRLVEEVAKSTDETVIVSHEMFAALSDRHVAQVMDAFAAREVHVVVTLRDFSRIVSASWQERAKNREIEPWPEFLDEVGEGPEGGHRFWRLQDAPRVLESWRAVVPGERIHVVTVPPLTADRQLLLRRFSQAVGLDSSDLRIPRPEANQSVGAVEIAVLQRLNAASAHLDTETYRRVIKNFVVPKILARRPDQVRVVLPESARPWVLRETDRIRRAIADVGCEVVGDLSDLDPTAIGAGSDERITDAPHEVTADQVMDASAEVIVELVTKGSRPRAAGRTPGSTAAVAGTKPAAGPLSRLARLTRRRARR